MKGEFRQMKLMLAMIAVGLLGILPTFAADPTAPAQPAQPAQPGQSAPAKAEEPKTGDVAKNDKVADGQEKATAPKETKPAETPAK
jgi:hypothetical protein